MKKLALHWQILLGMLLGIVFGFVMLQITGGAQFVVNWIKPFGTIFIRLLKLILYFNLRQTIPKQFRTVISTLFNYIYLR